MINLPSITKNLLIINVLFFAGTYVAELYGIDLERLLGLHFFMASDFRAYQLFSYMFMHGSFMHLFMNMFCMVMFGGIMENTMGQKKYLTYYLLCGLGAGLIQELVQYIHFVYLGLGAYQHVNLGGIIMDIPDYLNRWNTVGASGAIYGLLMAFAMYFPNERMFIIPIPFPVKAKYFVLGYAVWDLLSGLTGPGDGVAHFAHLGGMLVGLLILLYWRRGGGNGFGRGRDYFGGRGGRGGNSGGGFMRWFSLLLHRDEPHITVSRGGKFAQDMDSRRSEKADEEELNRILDKVKRNGYGSLTEEEKKRLFDMSKR